MYNILKIEKRKNKRTTLGPLEYGELVAKLRSINRDQLVSIYLEILKILIIGGNKPRDIRCQFMNSNATLAGRLKKKLPSLKKLRKVLSAADAEI